jgi:hypothetical protein
MTGRIRRMRRGRHRPLAEAPSPAEEPSLTDAPVLAEAPS